MIFIASIDILTQDEAHVHLISFSSTCQKRVISSPTKAEGYQLTEVVEAGDLLRAAIADCHGMLDHQNWETSAAAWCTMQWVTDCRSLVATLEKPIMKNTDKRLGIELASLRQYLWRRRGNDKPDRRMLEELPEIDQRTDYCCWVDTSVMVADCLTKLMNEDFFHSVMQTGIWNYAQTAEAKAIKLRKAEGVQRRKAERKAVSDSEPEPPSGAESVDQEEFHDAL